LANESAAPSKPAPKKSVALSGVVAGNTALCTVGRTGNDLHYRGYDILDVAETCEFEEIAHLLVHGSLPTPAELDLQGLEITPAALEELLAVNPKLWQEEFAGIGRYLGEFGDRVPQALKSELQGAVQRLHSSQV